MSKCVELLLIVSCALFTSSCATRESADQSAENKQSIPHVISAVEFNHMSTKSKVTGKQIVHSLIETITNLCPEAKITVAGNRYHQLTAEYEIREYTVHHISGTDDISEETYQEEGPSPKGFILKVAIQDGFYRGPLVGPFLTREPYYIDYFGFSNSADGTFYQVTFKYGFRLNRKLKRSIYALIPTPFNPTVEMDLNYANQKLDPTVKTPVESGKVQGIAGQP